MDDLLDLTATRNWQTHRTDVHEGNDAPIICALTMLRGSDRIELADVLTNFSDCRWKSSQICWKRRAFRILRLLISNHIDRSLEYLEFLPESDARSLLAEIAEISRSRTS